MHEEHSSKENKNWYDRSYKLLLIIPIALLIISIFYLYSFHSKNGDFIYRDSSLSGGTSITINSNVNIEDFELALKQEFSDIHIRTITDISTGRHLAVIVDSSAEPQDLVPIIEDYLGYELTSENSSIEFSGSVLGDNFYKQLVTAIIISFILMSVVVFILFRTFVPSIAVIFAAFADIVMTLAAVNLFGIRLSAAGIAAFLMLIGYSVDTDILLTTRVVKKRVGTVNERIFGSFKTGMFMTLTALAAVLPAFFIVTGLPDSFRQIFLILAFGLFFDIVNTWLTNASIIKWYADARGL